MRPDFKKLVTAFLAFAMVTGSGIYILSLYWGQPSSGSDIVISTRNPNVSGETNSFVGERSLLPAETSGTVGTLPPPPIDPTNLTQQLARGLAQGVVSANPNGPAPDKEGNLAVQAPSASDISSLLDENSAAADFRQKISDLDMHIKNGASKSDVVAYFNQLDDSLQKTIGSPDFKQVAASDPSAASVDAGSLIVYNAYEGAKNVTVPAELKNFHKDTLQFLSDSRNSFEAIRNYEIDPAKALVAAQSAGQIVNRDLAAMQRDADAFKSSKLYSELNSGEKSVLMSFYEKYFGVQTAMAAAGTAVPVDFLGFTFAFADAIKKWGETIYEWGQNIALQVLKNTLITMFAQQATSWISGGGSPQYITNWTSFLDKASSQGTLQSLHSLAASSGGLGGGLCDRFGPQMLQGLSVQFNTFVDPSRCNIGTFGNQLKAFNQDFSNGGWEAFAQAASPQGNYLTSYLGASIKIQEDAAKAEAAAQAKALASKGFESKKTCVIYDEDMYGTGSAGNTFALDSTTEDCPEGTVEQIQTPGATVADTLSNALNSNTQLISGANDVIGLAVVAAQSMVQKLMNSGSGGLTNISKVQISNLTDTCAQIGDTEGINSQDYKDCVGSAGAVDAQTADTAAKEDLRNKMADYARNAQTNADNINSLKQEIQTAIGTLGDVKDLCGSYPTSTEEYNRYNEAVTSTINLNAEGDYLSNSPLVVESAENIQNEANTLLQSSTAKDITDFENKYGGFAAYNTDNLKSFLTDKLESTANKDIGIGINPPPKCALPLPWNELTGALKAFNTTDNNLPGASSVKFTQ